MLAITNINSTIVNAYATADTFSIFFNPFDIIIEEVITFAKKYIDDTYGTNVLYLLIF